MTYSLVKKFEPRLHRSTDLRSNGLEKLVIIFNKSDIKDLINILDLTLRRSDNCEYKTKKFHIGRLGERLIFFKTLKFYPEIKID
jgi:hypothetical protein